MTYPNRPPPPPPPQSMGSTNTVFITETRFDASYLKTLPGILKVVVIVSFVYSTFVLASWFWHHWLSWMSKCVKYMRPFYTYLLEKQWVVILMISLLAAQFQFKKKMFYLENDFFFFIRQSKNNNQSTSHVLIQI